MRRPTYSAVASTAALVLAAGGVGWAATLPANSVGSPQIKNGAVASVDIKDGAVASADIKNGGVESADVKNGSLKAVDLAPGVLPTAGAGYARGVAAYSGHQCQGGGGWCYLATAGSGSVVARIGAPPTGATGWHSTGELALGTQRTVLLSGTVNVWSFGSGTHDALCTIQDGTTNLVSSGWHRIAASTSLSIAVSGYALLDAGSHDLRVACRGSDASETAVDGASIQAIAIEPPA